MKLLSADTKTKPLETDLSPPGNGEIAKHKTLFYWSGIALVVLAGLWLRTDDLIAWHQQPHRAFYNNQPLLINFDGYYYLSLARDLRLGTYDRVDSLRGVPESPLRPAPPPMISLLTAAVALFMPLSLEWIAVLLPPLLGLSLAVPLALFGRLYGSRLMALAAVAMGLFPSYYVYRSHLGWYDTDCLNVTFLLMVCYLFIRFGLEQRPRRYAYLAGGVTNYILFLLWWDQTPAVVTLISFSPLVIVLLLYYRPMGRERWMAICVGLALVGGLALWQGPDMGRALFHEGVGQLAYISKQQAGDFPNVGVSVHEQKRLPFEDLVKTSAGHPLSFSIGLAGLIGLFWRQRGKVAALVVPFVLGCFSFLFARRFLIFLNPFLAIGFGFAAQWLWELHRRWRPLQYAAPLLIVAALFVPFRQSLRQTFWPKEIPPLVEGMDRMSKLSAKDAIVWAWWDHGYPMLYWAQRATISDGSLHGGLRTVCNAIPLAADNARSAADFMRFYSVHGIGGLADLFSATQGPANGMAVIKDVLAAGPDHAADLIAAAGLMPVDRWVQFFFPDPSRELYLFLDLRLARTSYWWHWFGTWDVGKQDGLRSNFEFFIDCRRQDDVVRANGLRVDLSKGLLSRRGRRYPLKKAYVREDQSWKEIGYTDDRGLLFTFDSHERVATIMDDHFAHSLFTQLYVFKQPDSKIFSLIAENYPYYQIWKIRNAHMPKSGTSADTKIE